MSITSNNNKETFKLLDVSSETDSDVLQIEIAPRKKRINRSRRGRSRVHSPNPPAERWGQRALALGAAAALLAWLAALSWAAAALSADTRRLDAALREVSMGSQGVGDALQRCHSAARELQHNHTEMAARLDKLVLRADNLTSQVSGLQSGLAAVQQQLVGTPELVSAPQQLAVLERSVARFGSQLRDLDATVTAMRAQAAAQADAQDILHHNVTDLKVQVGLAWNKSMAASEHSGTEALVPLQKQQTDLQTSLQQLVSNVSVINNTLATKIDWATRDFNTDHHKVTGLLESVQNNSAALSSLQTAWRQSNDIISRNVTVLSQQVTDKTSELERQVQQLKQLQSQLPPSPSPAVPPTKSLHERDSGNIYDIPKLLASSTQPPVTTKAAMRAATGKPSIVSSSGSA